MHTLYAVYAHSNVLPHAQRLTRMGKYAPAVHCSSAHPNYFMGVVSGCPFCIEVALGASVLSAVRNRRFSEVGFVLKL